MEFDPSKLKVIRGPGLLSPEPVQPARQQVGTFGGIAASAKRGSLQLKQFADYNRSRAALQEYKQATRELDFRKRELADYKKRFGEDSESKYLTRRVEGQREKAESFLVKQRNNLAKLAIHEAEKQALPMAEGYARFAESEGFKEAFREWTRNPVEVIANVTMQSLIGSSPSLVTTALGSAFGPIGTAAGAFSGAFAVEQAASLLEYMGKEGVNVSDVDEVRKAFSNPELMSKVLRKANAKAGVVALAEGVSGGLSGRMGIGKEVLMQLGLEGAGEAGGQLAAEGGIEGKEVFTEMLGAGPQSVVEYASNKLNQMAKAPPPKKPLDNPNQAIVQLGLMERAFPKAHRLATENFVDNTRKAVRTFARPRTAKGFKESPAGLEAIDRTNDAVVEGGIIFGENMSAHEKALTRLNSRDRAWARKNFKVEYEQGGLDAMPNQRLRDFAEAWRGIADRVGAKAEELEVMIFDDRRDDDGNLIYENGKRPFKRTIENYFPRRLTPQIQRALRVKKGRIYDALVEIAKDRDIPIRGLEEANTIVDQARKYGHLESPRIGELPETLETSSGETIQVLEKDPFKVIESYINGAAERLSIIEAFSEIDEETGKIVNGQESAYRVADKISHELGITHPDTQREWNSVWANLNGQLEKADTEALINTGIAAPLRFMENIARVMQLSVATISQIAGGWLPIAVRGGAWNTVKAATQYAASKVGLSPKTRAELELTRNMGAWDHYVMGHTFELEDVVGLSQTIARKGLTATGFVASNRMLNQIGSMVALDDFVDSIAILRSDRKDGGVRRLWGRDKAAIRKTLRDNYEFTDAEIDEIIDDGIDYSDAYRIQDKARKDARFQKAYYNMAQAAQRMTANTNLFRESVLNRPPWMSRKAARMFLAYMSYMRQMGNLLSDSLKHARHGNVKPLVTLLVGGKLAGGMIKEFKDLLFKREEEPDENAFDTLKTLLDWQLEAGVYGLAGSFGENAYWAIKLRQPAGLDIPLLDWWMTNAVGTTKAVAENDMMELYNSLAKSTPIVRAIDAQMEGPLYQSKDRGASKISEDIFK